VVARARGGKEKGEWGDFILNASEAKGEGRFLHVDSVNSFRRFRKEGGERGGEKLVLRGHHLNLYGIKGKKKKDGTRAAVCAIFFENGRIPERERGGGGGENHGIH